MDPSELYSKVQDFVKKEATDIYNEKATQFGVADTSAHTHDGTDSQFVNYTNLEGRSRFILYRVVLDTTDTATGLIGGTLVMPFGGNFTLAGATVDIAGVTGSMVIDVLLNGTTVFRNTSHRINIATGATTSRGNANQPFFQTFAFTIGDILTFNVVSVQTTPAKGLTIFFRVNETTT